MRVIACPPAHDGVLPHDALVHPGFGVVTLCKDGVEDARDVTGDHALDWYTKRVKRATHPAEPPAVWTLHIDGPLRSLVYALTVHGWTIIEHKDGFA